MRKGPGHDSADGPTETIEYNSTLRGTTLPQKVAPRKAQQLLYSLHVPEVAEFNPKGVIQSSSSVSCPCLRGKHCPVRTLVAYLLCLQKPSYITRPRVHLETWFWLHKMQILLYRTYPYIEYF